MKYPGFASALFCMGLLFFVQACNKHEAERIDIEQVATESVAEAEKAGTSTTTVYYFGFDIRRSPQEDARQYLPLMQYLQQATGYQFEIRFLPKDKSAAQMLAAGKFHFAAMGAASYIRAKNAGQVIPLVRGLNSSRQSRYQSFLVTLPGSSISSLGDLRGRSFAFGDRDSTQGHLIPRIILEENGLSLNQLSKYFYTGSHRNCAEAVLSGKADVCGLQDTLAKEMIAAGKLKPLHQSRYFPSSGIVAHADVQAEVVDKVRLALLQFDPAGKHSESLYNWHLTEMPLGFETANREDYDSLERWMRKLEFID